MKKKYTTPVIKVCKLDTTVSLMTGSNIGIGGPDSQGNYGKGGNWDEGY